MASWISRLPAVRAHLTLSPGQVGTVLLALSVGSMGALPLAGALVRRVGPAVAVRLAFGAAMAGLALAGVAGSPIWLAAALAVYGAGIGLCDVAMNVEGAEVERRLGRSLMPRLHAAFSLGTVAGAVAGAGCAAGQVPVPVQLPGTAVAMLAGALLATRHFLPTGPAPTGPVPTGPAPTGPAPTGPAPTGPVPGAVADPSPAVRARSVWAAWGEPRTLTLGLLVLSMAFAEGTANDWLTLALVDGYGATQSWAAAGFGLFVAGMTLARLAGPWVLERRHPAAVLRGSALLVLAGSALVVIGAAGHGRAPGWAWAGAALGACAWGLGAALGFPVGMTAAATDPVHAAARVAVVSTIGYAAFLAGPPLLGALAQRVGVAHALPAVWGAVLIALATAGAAARPDSTGPDSPGPDSAGPDSPGPDSPGPDSPGPHSAGPDSAGPG